MNNGTIIILNGTSSSGKTSIVNALQGILPAPYLDAGIDKFIWMLPERYLDRPLWDEVLGLAAQAGQVGHLLMSGMHQSFDIVHAHGIYDLEVDTSRYAPEACALQIQARIENGAPPMAFKRLKLRT